MTIHMTFFVFLYRPHKMFVSPENLLCEYGMFICTRKKFILNFFDIFKFYFFYILYTTSVHK
jgi:hypothetical protein